MLGNLRKLFQRTVDTNALIRLETSLTGWFNKETGELITDFPIKPTDIVLDVGCGDGHCTHFCVQQGAEVIFTDISSERITKLVSDLKVYPNRKIHPIVSDTNPLPLPDDVADKVIARDILEHVDDPAQLMQEIVRIGKQGALFLITAPAAQSENIQKEIAPPSYFEKPNHIRILQVEETRNIIEQSGLMIEKSFNCGFFWTIWWLLFWACKRDLLEPWHPILVNWGRTWNSLLKTEDGPRIKKALDNAFPKSNGFIARKP